MIFSVMNKRGLRGAQLWNKRAQRLIYSLLAVMLTLVLVSSPLATAPVLHAEDATAVVTQVQPEGGEPEAGEDADASTSSPVDSESTDAAGAVSEGADDDSSPGAGESFESVPADEVTPETSGSAVLSGEEDNGDQQPVAGGDSEASTETASEQGDAEGTESDDSANNEVDDSDYDQEVASASVTGASSGSATSAGVVADNEVGNQQVAAAVTGGGDGDAEAVNSVVAAVVEEGQAASASGFAGAVGGTAQSVVETDQAASSSTATSGGAPAGSVEAQPTDGEMDCTEVTDSAAVSVTTSTSGDAVAIGVAAVNNVATSTEAAVLIAGANEGSVEVHSSTQIGIANEGLGIAVSGQATADGGDALAVLMPTLDKTGSAIGVTNGVYAEGALVEQASEDQSATGLSDQRYLESEQNTRGTLSGDDAHEDIVARQAIGLENVGYANVSTDDVSAAADLAAAGGDGQADADNVVSSETNAASGDATAVGVSAINNVATNANVNVQVLGGNFSLINVVVETVVSIINVGQALAQTGSATSEGGDATNDGTTSGAGGQSVSATSGDAEATGARMTNEINATNDTQIVIEGDNHNPLNIVIEVFAGIFNLGSASAHSGDAQASGNEDDNAVSGSSDVNAESGSAEAYGLSALNNINVGANVGLLLTGSNYSPINVTVRLLAEIFNGGSAVATTGDASAVGSSVSSGMNPVAAPDGDDVGENTDSEQSNTAETPGSPDSDDQGNTVETQPVEVDSQVSGGSTLDVQVESSGDGQKLISTGRVTTEAGQTETTASYAVEALSATVSRSGDAASVGVASDTNIGNLQVAAVNGNAGEGENVAANSAAFAVVSNGTAYSKSGNAVTGSLIDPDTIVPDDGNNNNGPTNNGNHGNGMGGGILNPQQTFAPWPYPWQLNMPNLVQRIKNTGMRVAQLPLAPLKMVENWVSVELPRPEGLIADFATMGGLMMPDAGLGETDSKSLPSDPWRNLYVAVAGLVSLTGLTSYRYRRQLKPLLHSFVNTIMSMVTSL